LGHKAKLFLTTMICLTSGIGMTRLALAQTAAWAQWGQNPQHTGAVALSGQPLQAKLGDVVFDPFVNQEIAESGALLMHYQAALVNAPYIFMEVKSGAYTPCKPPGSKKPFPCGPDAWKGVIWNETAWQWQNGQLASVWSFSSDWKPVPNSGSSPSNKDLGGWEPLFQPALSGSYIYVPGTGGTIYRLSQSNGAVAAQINPFGTVDSSIFVFGPLTADGAGNIFYNAVKVNLDWPWDEDVVNAWLVKVAPDDSVTTTTYTALLPGAPTDCLGTFRGSPFPWPPSKDAVPRKVPCGSQRPPLNIAPAISADGSTLYTASRGHFWGRGAYLLAVNTADLSLQWSTSLQGLLDDGCDILLPPDGQPGGCRTGSTTGVDPTQNTLGGAILEDGASASPVVAPDGSILLGVNTAYNYGRGHLLKFSAGGKFEQNYDFGWDSTPAVFPHDGTYSVLLKDNHYDNGSYCSDPTWCPRAPRGPYYITQLDSNLVLQWQYEDPSVKKGHPNGFEWCVNAPAVDANGVVYGNNEDGYLYAVQPGGTQVQRIFLDRTINAGYTPVTLGGDGMIYGENAGHLIAIGQLFATTTQITSSSQNPSTFGQPVTFTAQVSSAMGVPTGTVQFKIGTTVLGKGALTNGVATYQTAPTQLPGGKESVTAVYGGDGTHAGSSSSPFLQTVNPAATSTLVSDQPNPSAPGQQVTITATVTSTPGTPTGNVVFKSNGTVLGTVPLAQGQAVLQTTFTQSGKYSIKAFYQGSRNYRRSTGTVMQLVQ
jgi:hypothetical protein